MDMIIYKITNKINGKCYIGQTTESMAKRWKRHIKKTSHCTALKNAILKYGSENFTIEEISKAENLTQLNLLESEFIIKFNTLSPNGYNMTSGGENPAATDDVRKRLSELNSGENHPRFGKKHAVESKEKISQSLKGRLQPWHKGNSYRKGSSVSEETKLVISEAIRKPIICNETQKIYRSVSEAAKFLSVSVTSVSDVLRGKNKTCKGYTFSYMEKNNV